MFVSESLGGFPGVGLGVLGADAEPAGSRPPLRRLASTGPLDLVSAFVIGVWYLALALICISLIANNVEHLSMCLFIVHMSFLVKSLLKSFARFYWVVYFHIIEI